MLEDSPCHATLPTKDLEKSRAFYEGALGFKPDVQPGGVLYNCAGGTRFLVYPTQGTSSGAHTQLGWVVDDIDVAVARLKQAGVGFEQYDFPCFDTATSIATTGPNRAAWFKDPDGNLLGIVQLG